MASGRGRGCAVGILVDVGVEVTGGVGGICASGARSLGGVTVRLWSGSAGRGVGSVRSM